MSKRRPGKQRPLKPAKGPRPLFVLKFVGDSYAGKFYSADVAWEGTTRDNASRLTHRDVRRAQGKLKRLGCQTLVEPA